MCKKLYALHLPSDSAACSWRRRSSAHRARLDCPSAPPHLANTTNIQSFYYENLLISVVLGCGRCQPQPFTPTFAATPPPPSQPAPPQCSRTMFQSRSNATFFRPQPHHPVKTTHIQRFYYENQLIFVVLGCEGCNPQPSRFPQCTWADPLCAHRCHARSGKAL